MTEHVPSKEKLEHLRHLRVLLKCGEYDGAHIMQAWLALDEYAAMLERAADEPCEGPFVVADGGSTGENRFRTMKQGFSAWTLDINEALQFARRKDAELFAAEDDEAWQVLPVPTERSAAEPKPTGAGLISGTTVGASCSPAASSSTQPPAAPLQWYGIYGHLVPVSPNGVADTALRVDRKSAHDVYLKDDVDRLLAQRAAQPPRAWQPIATAPKDEEAMFWIRPLTSDETWCNTSGQPIVIDSPPELFVGKRGRWSSLWAATHWMPLPEGPGPTKCDGDGG